MSLTAAEKQDIATRIANAKAILLQAEPAVNKARMAGVDVSAQAQALTDLKKQIQLLELHYGQGT